MYESGEDYLETILLLSKRENAVRSIDIAREMEFSKPSVSRAVGILKESGFININENGYITLTNQGKQKADSIYERHQLLTDFLAKIAGVSLEVAEADACKMEHIISNETFLGIKEYMKKNNNRNIY